jgi:hypothetical protein
MAVSAITFAAAVALVAKTVSASVALPAGGSPTAVLVTNLGNNAAYIALGSSSVVASPSNSLAVAPGESVALVIGSATYIAAITDVYATQLNVATVS